MNNILDIVKVVSISLCEVCGKKQLTRRIRLQKEQCIPLAYGFNNYKKYDFFNICDKEECLEYFKLVLC